MKKKLILGMSIGCAAVLACTTALALSHSNMLRVKAGGNDRTLTFNSTTSLYSVNGNDLVSNLNDDIRVYSNYASNLSDGLLKTTGTGMFFIFYNQVESNYYHGFEQATITNIQLSYKVNTDTTLTVCWAQLTDEMGASIYSGTPAALNNISVTSESEVTTLNISTGDFINHQADAKSAGHGYPSICLTTSMGASLSIYSITVSYTCL